MPKSAVKAFFVSYHVPKVGVVWWKESMSAAEAFPFARELAKKGFRPTVVTAEISLALISAQTVCRQHIRPGSQQSQLSVPA